MTAFHDQIIAKARATRAKLDAERRTLAALTRDDERVQAHYQALGDGPRVPGVPNAELEVAFKASADYGDRRRRHESLVRDLEAESAQLNTKANAPESFSKATMLMAEVRAAVVAAVAKRQKSADRVARLRDQLAAEQTAATAGRAWQKEQLLARIEGREQPESAHPEHSPEQCEQAAALIVELMDTELATQAQIDDQIASLKANEAKVEAAVLEQGAYVREVEYAEALAAFAPVWTRFKAAHIAAFDFAPAVPDLNELADIGIDEALIEARQALVADDGGGGLLRRGLRKLGESFL